jgi:hypothetical protein
LFAAFQNDFGNARPKTPPRRLRDTLVLPRTAAMANGGHRRFGQ